MWLDAFIYLPLVILGIHRLMDQRKPTLLFVSYFLLFITNYYFGFMIVVFLPVLFYERLQTGNDINLESLRILLLLLAGGASMIMVLPAVLDLRTNGETLSEITTFKTEATAF